MGKHLFNKPEYKQTDVYAIRNKTTGKVYIGSTITSFNKRWSYHIYRLNKNKHINIFLQRAWNKYGKDNFIFEIIEICSTNVRERELHWIKCYSSTNMTFGYNLSLITDKGSPLLSKESRAKISLKVKELWKQGVYSNSNNWRKGLPTWNKGLKCSNISNTRRSMFSSIAIYRNNNLIVTFRSMQDLEEYTKNNELPGLLYNKSHKNQGTICLAQNVHRAIKQNKLYRGLKFKKVQPLSPEMGIAKWENCGKGEIPNPQPSLELTIKKGSETKE